MPWLHILCMMTYSGRQNRIKLALEQPKHDTVRRLRQFVLFVHCIIKGTHDGLLSHAVQRSFEQRLWCSYMKISSYEPETNVLAILCVTLAAVCNLAPYNSFTLIVYWRTYGDVLVVCVQPDYVSMSQRECYLCHLEGQSPGVFPRVASVLSWKEVNIIQWFHATANITHRHTQMYSLN